MLDVLKCRAFRHLFGAQISALFGTGLTSVALALLAYELAEENAGQILGYVLALKMIAYVAIAPIAGAFANRFSRRHLLVILDILRASLVLTLPWINEVWQVYVLIFLLNACSAIFTPVFQASIPDILPDEDDYTQALSLSRLAYDLENLLSPTFAAVLLMISSFDTLFVVNSITFIVSALLIVSVVLPQAKPDEQKVGFLRKVNHGILIYFKTPRLRGLIAFYLAVASAGAMQIVNTVAYVRTELGLGESAVALAYAAAGGGSMLAAFIVPALLRYLPERTLMLIGGIFMCLSLLLGLFQPAFVGLLALWFLLGFGSSLVQTPSGRLLRRSCTEQDRPVLYAAQFSLSHACWLLTYPLAGWLGANVGFSVTFAVLALVTLLSTVTAWRFWPKNDPSELMHQHDTVTHEHLHYHDVHHQHEHNEPVDLTKPHSHPHSHEKVKHSHVFVIDSHHRQWPR